MKKLLPFIVALVLVTVLVACGEEAKDDMKNEMTTLKDGATSMMDDISSALGELDDDLTQNGNVTDEGSSTGLFESMTSDGSTTEKETTKEKGTTDKNTTDKNTTDTAVNAE